MKTPVRSLEFDQAGFDDLAWWVQNDRKKALRILRLISETLENPFGGVGKPEPLKNELAGCWSKRIDQEHRLVYRVQEDKIRILACRYHYLRKSIDHDETTRRRGSTALLSGAFPPLLPRHCVRGAYHSLDGAPAPPLE